LNGSGTQAIAPLPSESAAAAAVCYAGCLPAAARRLAANAGPTGGNAKHPKKHMSRWHLTQA